MKFIAVVDSDTHTRYAAALSSIVPAAGTLRDLRLVPVFQQAELGTAAAGTSSAAWQGESGSPLASLGTIWST